MTIDEAIYKLERQLDGNPALKDLQVRQAIHLGIEALRKLRELRTGRGVIFDRPLPGETEE